MARASYDDWNFMGEVRTDEQRVRSARSGRARAVNNARNSFIFLCIVILMTLMGLVCIYSASYETAVNEGRPHYYYLMMQGLYLGIGVVLMVFVNVIPEGGIKILCPVLFFLCIVAQAVEIILKKNFLMTPDTIGILFLSGVMYMSLYFSGRNNNIQRGIQILPPLIGTLLVLGMILMQRNFSYAVMFLALMVTMFAAGGVGLIGILLLLLYALVPAVCMLFSTSERILAVAEFLVPGFGTNVRADSILTVKSAIASGSWFGKGLGGGVYKGGVIDDIAGRNILACICEELGFWGMILIMLFFALYAFVGYLTARNIRKSNGFCSNLAIGITTMLVWQFILNVAWVLGFIPGEGLPLPFFSFGIGIIPVLFESGLLYRVTRTRTGSDKEERLLDSIQNELMFPERYDFENN